MTTEEITQAVEAPILLPTIGRVVHVWLRGREKPEAAIVSDVIPQPSGLALINAGVFGPSGSAYNRTSMVHRSVATETTVASWDWPERV